MSYHLTSTDTRFAMAAGRSTRALVPLYAASAVLTLGEGSFGLLTPPYMNERGVDEVFIGAAISFYGLMSLLARVPAGAAYRTERASALIAGGCFLCAVAFALVPLTGDPALLGVLIGLNGVGFAVATTGVMAALIERRPEGASAGSIMGWYTGSVGVGYALAGLVGGSLGDLVGLARAIWIVALVPLVAGVLLATIVHGTRPTHGTERTSERRTPFGGFRGTPALVWLAFFVTLYINLVSGVVLTFFPIYGLQIGLTLTQIGILFAIHGAAAALVRFGSGLLFRWIPYERTLPVMVLLSGAAVAGIASVEVLAVLALAWALIGVARGLLRVASAALVMDSAGPRDTQRGAASGIYLAGLDLGKIVGPIVGGVAAGAIGLRATFLLAGILFPLVYLVFAAHVVRRPAPAAT
jgi:MFS family permease